MTWAATEAKAKFSEMLDKAENEGAQLVRRRRQEFIVLTRREHDLLSGKRPRMAKKIGTLGDFFRNSPLAGSGIKIERLELSPRRVEF